MTNLHELSSYDYILPESQIAQYPTQPQHDCKLLYCQINNNGNLKLEDKIFKNIVDILTLNDHIYFNNSKVVPSRIYISSINIYNNEVFWSDWLAKHIESGELFWLRQMSADTHEFLVRPWSKLKTWTKINLRHEDNIYILEIIWNTSEGREVRISNNINIYDLLEKFGNMPLPPYIWYDKSKDNDYQPVFAKTPGSVASPTASLHFTDYIMNKLDQKWISQNFVTLHVGMWTFKSVDSEDITKHNIHGETAEIDIQIFETIYTQKISGWKILSVGTTSARTMESLPYLFANIYGDIDKKYILTSNLSDKCIVWWKNLTKDIESNYIYNIKKYWDSLTFETRIYIYPWYSWKIVDNLVTNFHLPKSSLMTLVASKMWYENMMETYKHAIDNDYRFYSFGDAMYIELF